MSKTVSKIVWDVFIEKTMGQEKSTKAMIGFYSSSIMTNVIDSEFLIMLWLGMTIVWLIMWIYFEFTKQ